ncbi:transposon DNA-invertase [Jeotgalibaca sp. PTS2502]|uniref:Recombinase family protein n=1 Tax=Aerococcus agrisoli TaxID=2487350 RepID=A0A3N4FWR4_9LACT|nr:MULTISPECIES: recombinase family protein [Lactobacillales]APZ49522.1 transposon DNA-invertase [Jeotgalibaca sp. PTS2502]RPA55189.1 recombinase family protein [Aerococcus agrisoli]
MKVGYARVSTTDQNLDRQMEALERAGAEKIFQEKMSGKSMTERLELQKALQFLREKDTLIVESLDRLGRNYDDIVQMVQKLDQKEIGLIVLNLPILNQEIGDPNLQKLIRNMIVQLLSWTAQNEREEIKRKQRQGIEIAKRKGHYKGRPVKYSANAKNPKDRMTYQVIVNKLTQEEPIKQIAEDTGVTRDTVYRIKKELTDTTAPSPFV